MKEDHNMTDNIRPNAAEIADRVAKVTSPFDRIGGLYEMTLKGVQAGLEWAPVPADDAPLKFTLTITLDSDRMQTFGDIAYVLDRLSGRLPNDYGIEAYPADGQGGYATDGYRTVVGTWGFDK